LKLIRDQGIVSGITLRDFAASCYLPTRSHPAARRLLAPALTLLALVWLTACRRPPAGATSSPEMERLRASLALVPAEARIVLGLDLERLRATPLGKSLLDGLGEEAALLLDGFGKGAGFDRLGQVHQILVALPGERQNDDRLVLVAETRTLDRERAAAWLRERQDGRTAAFIHENSRIVIGKGAWAAEVAALAKPPHSEQSAARDEELRRLCERSAAEHAVWLAAIVPTPLRQRLMAEARFPDVGSIARLSMALAVSAGLRAEASAELSNEADARSLARRLSAFLNAAKHHPDMLAQGFSPYLEAVRLAARGPNVEASLELPADQTGDLAARLADLVRAAWPKPATTTPR
jgi:hypothetical protein